MRIKNFSSGSSISGHTERRASGLLGWLPWGIGGAVLDDD